VHVDGLLVEQVFINLLENATKHTPAGQPIDVDARREGNEVVVEIADRGPGLPAGEEQKIFDKFYGVGGGGGAGLGLTICRAIVEAHGGRIGSQNPPGVGELMARMRVALRHRARVSDGALESAFSFGELHVDLAVRRVTVGGAQVHLTPIEYRLLAVLVHHAGKVITHRQLLGEVWGPNATEQAHYLRVYMAHLRRKLEADAARPRYLLTEAGVGYRLAAE